MTNPPTASEIGQALETLLNSRTFAKTEVLRHLLDFLVRNAIQGNSSALSECEIAVRVLGRRKGFTPVEDSIVRKTMARLRDKLMVYYAGEGRSADVRVVIERGVYRPYFFRKEHNRGPSPGLSIPRVLLLPFNPLNFEDTAHFTDGLLEDLMIALAAGGGVRIVPWTTARYVRELTGDMREYHRLTGADVILDGTVRRLGDSLFQVTLTWVDGVTAVFDSFLQVRAGANDSSEAIHSLCEQIAGRLGSDCSEEGYEQVAPRHSADPEARRLYLRARQVNRLGTAEGTRTSFAYLARALELQPDYAAAYALMADTHIYAGISGLGVPREEMPAAMECAHHALAAAPRLGSALTAKGAVQFAYQWDFAGAKKSLTAGRARDATSDSTHYWSEAVFAASEDPVVAAARMEEHAEADNCSAATAYLAASYCYNACHWKRTEYWARRAIELDATYFRPYPFLAGACLEMGRPEEALTFAERGWRLSGPNPYTSGMLGIVLARQGRKSEARTLLADHAAAPGRYASSIGKAVIFAALNERAQAEDAIAQMIEDRDPYVTWLHIFPFFHSLREDQRFQNLLAARRSAALL